jgi:hypothetical protein
VDRKLLEAPVMEVSYYADVVGDVPAQPTSVGAPVPERYDIGNGDLPPEWGIDIVVRGGFLRYGPWADRQRCVIVILHAIVGQCVTSSCRAELQRAFFPPNLQNIEPTPRLTPGDKRVWTSLNVFIELRDETTLYIPFREASKASDATSALGAALTP